MTIDVFSWIGDIYKAGKMDKWWRLFAGTSIAAFLGFWGGIFVAGNALLFAGTHSLLFVLVGTFFSACGTMAASVAWTVYKQGMWKELGIALPPQLEKIVLETDVAEPTDNLLIRDGDDPEVRRLVR